MKRPAKKSEVAILSDGTFWLADDGIARAVAPRGAQDTLENARASLEEIKKVCGGKKRPVLVDIRFIKSATFEARNFWSGEEPPKALTAVALWVGSPVSKVMGNFYIGFNKTMVPTKLFTDKDKALQWLKEFIE